MDKKLERILPLVQKPARYTGGEYGEIQKDKSEVDLRMALCFPDTYEIGMSNTGMRILYQVLNDLPGVWCERVFAPWFDMDRQMREKGLPLYALESGDPLSEFDAIGFSLGYEMAYTTVLEMLDLAGIPLRSAERTSLTPLVFAGGSVCCNSEPMADFFDLMIIGEGESVDGEVLQLLREAKAAGWSKAEFLRRAALIGGVYVPSLYTPEYNGDGTLKAMHAAPGAPERITKRIVTDFENSCFPVDAIVPSTEIVHDRVGLELFRGCIRGCRFCQAGHIYRPVRSRSVEKCMEYGKESLAFSGYHEITLLSLSTSDYRGLNELCDGLMDYCESRGIGLSLPSLRADNFSMDIMQRVQKVRKSGLTFAPEAGTQRLRDVINKNITEDAVINTAKTAFSGGNTSVKLYFMLGLPTETFDDVAGIGNLAQKVVDTFYSLPERPKGKGVTVSVSCSAFVPKPFTPFQWEPQDDIETIRAKQKHLVESARSRKIRLSWSDPETSFLEAVLARGDRRVCAVIYEAFKLGCKFDSWGEYFHFDVWMKAFENCGVDPKFYANRRREYTEVLPWSHIDIGIPEGYFMNESIKAKTGATTQNCREKCNGCGANRLLGRACD